MGALESSPRDLSRFAPLAGGALKGEARIAADLDGAPRYGALTATVDAHATNLATAFPMLDQRDRRRPSRDRRRAHDAGRRLRLHRSVASGQHGSARLNGDFGRDKVDLGASVDVPQASVLDPRVAGKAEIVATLTGVPDDLNAAAESDSGRGPSARPQDVRRHARCAGEPHHRADRRERLGLSGDIDGHPLQGSAHVAKTADGGWRVDNLALSLASAKLAGDARDRRRSAGDWRAQLQRGESRRSLAARAHQDERRASGEGRAPRPPAAGRRSRSSRTATG